ncbi:MAG: phage tail terminator protein [Eggerthia catenaformis]|uniref:phage tail terminator protein n=1 Tax=Eggerthia catenaformis TaxID=31973 RepID=UPI003FA142F4
MLTLKMIKDWLKTLDLGAEHFYIGKLDNKNEKSLGVYNMNTSVMADVAIGGKENTKTGKKYITLLIHWDKNMDHTEVAAYKIYNKLSYLTNVEIEGIDVDYIELPDNEPIFVDTDKNGVYEMVINLIIYFKK